MAPTRVVLGTMPPLLGDIVRETLFHQTDVEVLAEVRPSRRGSTPPCTHTGAHVAILGISPGDWSTLSGLLSDLLAGHPWLTVMRSRATGATAYVHSAPAAHRRPSTTSRRGLARRAIRADRHRGCTSPPPSFFRRLIDSGRSPGVPDNGARRGDPPPHAPQPLRPVRYFSLSTARRQREESPISGGGLMAKKTPATIEQIDGGDGAVAHPPRSMSSCSRHFSEATRASRPDATS